MMMRTLQLAILLTAGVACSGFTAPRLVVQMPQRWSLGVAGNDNLPETSFGADAVPEGQRPVNEYLDLIRAPMFGWASEEVGTKGLLTRLAAVYASSLIAV